MTFLSKKCWTFDRVFFSKCIVNFNYYFAKPFAKALNSGEKSLVDLHIEAGIPLFLSIELASSDRLSGKHR